jgi:hypothetical protein
MLAQLLPATDVLAVACIAMAAIYWFFYGRAVMRMWREAKSYQEAGLFMNNETQMIALLVVIIYALAPWPLCSWAWQSWLRSAKKPER